MLYIKLTLFVLIEDVDVGYKFAGILINNNVIDLPINC